MRLVVLILLCVVGVFDTFRVHTSVSEGMEQRASSNTNVSEFSPNPLKSLAALFALGRSASSFQATLPGLKRPRNELGSINMAAIPDGGNVLIVGGGAVALLAAKKAALNGYTANFIAGPRKEDCKKLLYDEGEPELPNLNLLAFTQQEELDPVLAEIDGIIMAVDADSPVPDNLIDTVLPTGSKVKRVVAMSRNLNGKGMFPTATAAKKLANPDVWDLSTKAEYEAFEKKLKSKTAELGADFVICRAGTLKGGGPADANPDYAETKRTGLTDAFYKLGPQDIANWRMVFDCGMQGVTLLPGDQAEGAGFFAPTAATSYDKKAGDTGRHGIAGAMVHALGHGTGNRDFAVVTDEGTSVPTSAEWDALFAKLG